MSLLPANSTIFEREIEKSLHRVETIDVAAIKRMRDPWRCSVAHLPFLAWGRGVDFWFEDWPEHVKRRMTADVYRLKGMKGTLPGVDGYLSYVGAKVIEAVLPPQTVIARAQDPERIRQFRERFPEIRLYPFALRGERSGTVAREYASLSIVGRSVAHGREMGLLYGRRARCRDRGVETPIRSIDTIRVEADAVVPVTSFAIAALGRVTDAVLGRGIIGRLTATATRGRLITIGAGDLAASIPDGFEGVDVLNATPERVYERHGAKSRQPIAGIAAAAAIGSMIARNSEADVYIYDRWFLLDRGRAPADTYHALGPVIGRMVPHLKPHHAFVRVEATFQQHGRLSQVDRFIVGRSPARPVNDRILRVGAAIYRSKALHDTVRFTTRTHRPMNISDLSFRRPIAFGGMVPLNRSIR